MKASTKPLEKLEDFVKWYCDEVGFGSMNKNDFEVFIFNEYRKNKKKTNREMSLALQIPEAKVKRLSYEADLKYGYTEDKYKEDFAEIVKRAQYLDKKVKMVIENIGLRKFIEAQLKEAGKFLDSSFNSEIVTLEYSDFTTLLKILYKGKIKELQCNVKGQKTITELKDFAKNFGKDIAGNAIGEVLGEAIVKVCKI